MIYIGETLGAKEARQTGFFLPQKQSVLNHSAMDDE
jgi:hypothetical protein